MDKIKGYIKSIHNSLFIQREKETFCKGKHLRRCFSKRKEKQKQKKKKKCINKEENRQSIPGKRKSMCMRRRHVTFGENFKLLLVVKDKLTIQSSNHKPSYFLNLF